MNWAGMKRTMRFFLLPVTVGALAMTVGVTQPQTDRCEGILIQSNERLMIGGKDEGICIFDDEDKTKVMKVCSVGHRCEVQGKVSYCKDNPGCIEIRAITEVRDDTSGRAVTFGPGGPKGDQ